MELLLQLNPRMKVLLLYYSFDDVSGTQLKAQAIQPLTATATNFTFATAGRQSRYLSR